MGKRRVEGTDFPEELQRWDRSRFPWHGQYHTARLRAAEELGLPRLPELQRQFGFCDLCGVQTDALGNVIEEGTTTSD